MYYNEGSFGHGAKEDSSKPAIKDKKNQQKKMKSKYGVAMKDKKEDN
jgi:hypothetical protein